MLGAALWVKVLATPAIGAVADRSGISRRAVMGTLAAMALVGYAGLWPASGFGSSVALNLVALTAQSALMPLGDTVTLATCRPPGTIMGVSGSGALSPSSSPR